MKKEEDTLMSERKELSNTYMVQDRSSREELTRLHLQDEMLTNAMGGVLPEQPDPARFQRVIDIGCATGGWLINVAKAYPSIELLIGVDISNMMVKDARSRAEEAGVANRVEFHVMDSLRMIEFPRGYFDLVNHRLNFSYLRTWDWPNLLQKYQWAFLRKWSQVPQDYEQIYKQALLEMEQPDFRAEGKLLTVWGNNTGIKAAAHP